MGGRKTTGNCPKLIRPTLQGEKGKRFHKLHLKYGHSSYDDTVELLMDIEEGTTGQFDNFEKVAVFFRDFLERVKPISPALYVKINNIFKNEE